MKVAVLFSGGKDSTLTAFLIEQCGFEPVLVSFKPKKPHSYMLHGENVDKAKMVAAAMGKPHYMFDVSGEKEKEVEEMKKALEKLCNDIECKGIASGAIESEYQRQRVDYIGEVLGLPTYAPLWKRIHAVEDMLKHMDVRFVKVAAEGLDKELLGEPIDKAWNKKYIGHRLFEGGEAETIVLDAPFFKYRLRVAAAEKRWYGTWGEWRIEEIVLERK